MHRILPGVLRFGSILKEDQEELGNHFAGRQVNGIHTGFTTREGIPVLDGALAYFIVLVIDIHLPAITLSTSAKYNISRRRMSALLSAEVAGGSITVRWA